MRHTRPASFTTAFAGALALLTAACDSAPQWQDFSSEPGGYTISMPGEPEPGTRKVPIPNGSPLELQTASVKRSDAAYIVSYLDYPPALTGKVVPQKLLSETLKGAIKTSIQGEVTSETETKIGDTPCRRFEAKGKVKTEDASAQGIFCLQNNRLYQVFTIGKTKDTFTANATQFLDSFKITRTGA